MSQQSSLPQSAHSVRQVLTAYSQARQNLPVDELQEFADLTRKRITDGLTEDEHTRFVALYDRYPRKETLSLGDLSNPGPFGKIIPTNNKESES